MWAPRARWSSNLMTGVTKGFEDKLEINGVGYRAAVQGKNLQLALGYSHDVVYPIPEGIAIVTPKPTEISDHRHRQAEGRPGGRRNSCVPRTRALQGQGRRSTRASSSSARKARRSNGHRSCRSSPNGHERRKGTRTRRAQDGRQRPRAACRCSARRSTSMRRLSTTSKGETVASASSMEKDLRGKLKTGADVEAAKAIGKLVAERAKARAFPRSCSTAAAIAITGASRRWPTPPARADCSSNEGERAESPDGKISNGT